MAGKIPQTFIDQLLARVDIVEVIDRRVPLKRAGREYQARCPFHDEKTPSFTVSPGKQFYHCFGCGAHGSAIGFVMEYEGLGFVEAVEALAQDAGLEVPREAGPARDRGRDLYGILEQAARWYEAQLRSHPARGRAVGYLKGRGLVGEAVARFRIGYAPPGWDGLLRALGGDEASRRLLLEAGLLAERDSGGLYDRLRDRIVFPIRDPRGRVLGFGGRILDGDGPKYLNSPETPVFHKGNTVYGLYEALHGRGRPERLLVVEGYMDVVALHQACIPEVVATLGTATTSEHVERLYRRTDRLVFCFDGDRAGRAAAWKALEQTLPHMRQGRRADFLFLPEGEDPDSLVRSEGADGFRARLDDALPLSEFLIRELRERSGGDSLDARARLVELARPLVERVPEGVFRDLLAERLGREAGTDGARLARHLAGPPAPGAGARPAARSSRRTPVRLAITLLLARPRLADRVQDPAALADPEMAGTGLLAQLLDLLQKEPHLSTTAMVLEHLREHPDARILSRLAAEPVVGEDEGLEREFLDTIDHLRRMRRERRWQALQRKLSAEGLTPEELNEWNQILRETRTGDAETGRTGRG